MTLVLHDANTKIDDIVAVLFLGVEEGVDNKLIAWQQLQWPKNVSNHSG